MPNVTLPLERQKELIKVLKNRFEKNMNRHKNHQWTHVQTKLKSNSKKLWSLYEMEKTGGEPDIVAFDKKTGEYIFYDCSTQSPKGRRSLCYDREAMDSRKQNKPKNNVLDMAASMGVELLSPQQYRKLQELGNFDTTTSSWIKTPPEIRSRVGALFADFRYGQVFIYHNSAPSYYASRGFRASLRI